MLTELLTWTGIKKLIIAGMISSQIHESGHFKVASEVGIHMEIDRSTYQEIWWTPNDKKATKIHAAGFEYMDKASFSLDRSIIANEHRLASGIHKTLYLTN